MWLRNLGAGIACALLFGCGAGSDAGDTARPSLQAGTMGASIQPVILSGKRAEFTVTETTNGWAIVAKESGAVTNVGPAARVRFADASLSFDTDGSAGKVYRLYQAVFNRPADVRGLGYWIERMDQGTSLEEIAAGFSSSTEFQNAYGGVSNAELVARLYRNVLHREGEQAGLTWWTSVLDQQKASLQQALVAFSESIENQVGVLPSIQAGIGFRESGIAYDPIAVPGASRDVRPGQLVTLDGKNSIGSDGAALSYSWRLSLRPEGSTSGLVQSNTATPSFMPDQPGVYEVTLTVTENGRTSTPATQRLIALWSAPDGMAPATGNFVYLESEYGDYIGGGRSYLYKQDNTVMNVTATGGHLSIRVDGDESWNSNFKTMDSLGKIQPGYYANLQRWPFHNPAVGGFDWSGEGRGCNTLSAWVFVESVSYSGDSLTAISLRFEQHCEGGGPALRGHIRWDSKSVVSPPGPTTPPAGLWEPSPDLLPKTGNYVLLQGTSSDYIIGPNTYLYTQANSVLNVTSSGAYLRVGINGNKSWWGDFVGMNTLTRLQPGYYGSLQRYPFHNATRGGISWSGDGRGCNTLKGWFIVDSVTYTGTTLTAIDLRFQQHCEGGASYMVGKIHWKAGDTTVPPGPV